MPFSRPRALTAGLTIALLGTALAGCAAGEPASGSSMVQDAPVAAVPSPTAATASASLTADLQYLIEEEKLAHDVYVTLGDAWGLRVFEQIAASETSHQDAVAGLLETYQIPDPRQDGVGEFSDPALQSLYDTLVAQGLASREGAIQAGITIEQTDIADLNARVSTAPADVERVLESLLRGSENHLAAFERQA